MTTVETDKLTTHLRAATADLALRPGFAADVLEGGRRRRTRARIAIGATVAVTAAVAVTAIVAVPSNLADAPPAEQPTTEQPGHPMMTSGGDLIGDAQFVQLATTAWQESLPTTRANAGGVLTAPLTEPHVTWAGNTGVGLAAIVSQQFTMPNTDAVESSYRGRPAIAVGLLVLNSQQGLDLIGLQLEGHWTHPGSFVLPDDRTVISVAYGGENRAMNISQNIEVDADGVSRRTWTKPLRYNDGVWLGQLPAGINPRNVRMLDSKPELDPNDAEERLMGRHDPLLFTSEYISGKPTDIPDRGLPWQPVAVGLGHDSGFAVAAWDIFQEVLRDSGLLDPPSYVTKPSRWTAVVGMRDGRTMIISSYQELDNPAYVFHVLVDADGKVEKITRGAEVDLSSPLRLKVQLPDDEGWVVAVDPDKQLRYRTEDNKEWSAPVTGADLLPADAVAVETGGQEFTLD
jgi:hypothetical protein